MRRGKKNTNKTLAALMNLPHAGAWLCLLAEPWCAASCRGAANTLPSIIQCKHTAQQLELRLQMTKTKTKDDLKCDSSYSVLHWLLHEVEALPARVELVLVRAFEVQQVANDLEDWEQEIFISRAEGTTCFEEKSLGQQRAAQPALQTASTINTLVCIVFGGQSK